MDLEVTAIDPRLLFFDFLRTKLRKEKIPDGQMQRNFLTCSFSIKSSSLLPFQLDFQSKNGHDFSNGFLVSTSIKKKRNKL